VEAFNKQTVNKNHLTNGVCYYHQLNVDDILAKKNEITEIPMYQEMLRRFKSTNFQYPEQTYEGRGIVMCAGGSKYFPSAWVSINLLRRVGCDLPIELWYLNQTEMDEEMISLLKPLDVVCIDASQIAKLHPCRKLLGWELKPYAIIFSRFAETMLLDADNIAVKNPAWFFDSPQFVETGCIFWPDRGSISPQAEILSICELPSKSTREFESGQIFIDKKRCWKALQLTMHMNEFSGFYYTKVHGDKETYHMAWEILNQKYSMTSYPVKEMTHPEWYKGGWGAGLFQHDFQGNLAFEHRGFDKINLNSKIKKVTGFVYGRECEELVEDLKEKWTKRNSVIFHKPSSHEEINLAQSIINQKYFKYERVNIDSRSMELLPDYSVGEGRQECEVSWSVQTENGQQRLILYGSNFITVKFDLCPDGVWRGDLLVREAMKLALHPDREKTSRPNTASYQIGNHTIQYRPGTMDQYIIGEITGCDPYDLRDIKNPPSIIVDVGAHIGVFSVYAKHLWPECRIWAFEPWEENFDLLAQNTHNLLGVTVYQEAVTSARSTEGNNLVFYSSPKSMGDFHNTGRGQIDERGESPVKYRTIKDILNETGEIDILKLDCEGAEIEILSDLHKLGMANQVKYVTGKYHGNQSIGAQIKGFLSETHDVVVVPKADDPNLLGFFQAKRKV